LNEYDTQEIKDIRTFLWYWLINPNDLKRFVCHSQFNNFFGNEFEFSDELSSLIFKRVDGIINLKLLPRK